MGVNRSLRRNRFGFLCDGSQSMLRQSRFLLVASEIAVTLALDAKASTRDYRNGLDRVEVRGFDGIPTDSFGSR